MVKFIIPLSLISLLSFMGCTFNFKTEQHTVVSIRSCNRGAFGSHTYVTLETKEIVLMEDCSVGVGDKITCLRSDINPKLHSCELLQ
jgi:hypothetical protein